MVAAAAAAVKLPPPADYSGALIETEQILEDDDDLMRQLEEIKEAQRTSGEDVQQTHCGRGRRCDASCTPTRR